LINALAVATVWLPARLAIFLLSLKNGDAQVTIPYEMINVPKKEKKWTVLIDMERKFVMPSGSRS